MKKYEEISSQCDMKKQSEHGIPHAAKDSNVINLQREFEILADDAEDAKLKTKRRFTNEGYGEKLLQQAIWTVSRFDHPAKH